MKKLLTVAGFLFFAACGKGGDFDKVLSEYGAFKDKICKCADKACADKEKAAAEAYLMDKAKSMGDKKPSKDQDEKFDKIQDEMEECAKKFESAEAPPAGGGDMATPPAGGDMATPPAGGEATPPAEGGEKPATP